MANHVLPALCILLAVGHLSAGNLVLNVKPDTISPGLTSDLAVNCSFTYNNQPNISTIVSLTISKAESNNSQPGPFSEAITIDSFTNQLIVKDNTNAITSGNMDSNTLDAFLSLSWSSPSQAESGFYRCDAKVLDDSGDPVDISTLAEVVTGQPDLDALIGIVGTLRADLTVVKQELESQVAAQNSTISDLQTKLDQQASDLEEAMYIKSETYNGSYYLASHVYVSGIELAEYWCNKSQGYLVEIDDGAEREFIDDFLGSFDSVADYVVGASKDNPSGHWAFRHSGNPVTYFKWRSGEPNDGLDCMYLLGKYKIYNMADLTCDQYGPFPFLCEVPEN